MQRAAHIWKELLRAESKQVQDITTGMSGAGRGWGNQGSSPEVLGVSPKPLRAPCAALLLGWCEGIREPVMFWVVSAGRWGQGWVFGVVTTQMSLVGHLLGLSC